jgi:dTDP-4-amino-4,6-dideoxygalactose transaminase
VNLVLRHQLAAYSPIPRGAGLAAAASGIRLRDDPRPILRELLNREYNAQAAQLCGSGTQALEVAMRIALMRAGRGAAVALPAFSCFDVATAAVGCNAPVVLYDINPETLAPDFDSLERALKAGAEAVVIAPLYGMPVPWRALEILAGHYGAMLIEDAAQGHGATWRGKRLGSLGTISILSFGRGKGWTGGGGGAVLTRGGAEKLLDTLPSPRLPSEARVIFGLVAQWTFGRPAVYGIPRSLPMLHLGETTFHAPHSPESMPRAAAAAVLNSHQASLLEAKLRKENANRILASVGGEAIHAIRPDGDSSPGYLRLPLRLTNGMKRFKSKKRAQALGISSGYPQTLTSLPALEPLMRGATPIMHGAERLVRELITVPTHSRLSELDIGEIVDTLRSIGRGSQH